MLHADWRQTVDLSGAMRSAIFLSDEVTTTTRDLPTNNGLIGFVEGLTFVDRYAASRKAFLIWVSARPNRVASCVGD